MPCLPSEWCRAASDAAPLERAPPGATAAVAFPIVTEKDDGSNKIRRGEDRRVSLHNATCSVKDRPAHHGLGWFLALARHLRDKGCSNLHGWSEDHWVPTASARSWKRTIAS